MKKLTTALLLPALILGISVGCTEQAPDPPVTPSTGAVTTEAVTEKPEETVYLFEPVPGESTSIIIPGVGTFEAIYRNTSINYLDEPIHHYRTRTGAEFTLGYSGEFRTAYFNGNSPSFVKEEELLKLTDDDIRRMAQEQVDIFTGGDDSFEETRYYKRYYSKPYVSYEITFSQMICGFRTENTVDIDYNGAGEIYRLRYTHDIDYSGLDLGELSAITEDVLLAHAEKVVAEADPDGDDVSVENIWLCCRNGEYYLSMTAKYTEPDEYQYKAMKDINVRYDLSGTPMESNKVTATEPKEPEPDGYFIRPLEITVTAEVDGVMKGKTFYDGEEEYEYIFDTITAAVPEEGLRRADMKYIRSEYDVYGSVSGIEFMYIDNAIDQIRPHSVFDPTRPDEDFVHRFLRFPITGEGANTMGFSTFTEESDTVEPVYVGFDYPDDFADTLRRMIVGESE